MALLIPDEIQEKLICHTCNKFLSFQPIKVYLNRKIKCGRCSEKEDAGVVSLYNLLAKQGLFKCVNKFDGCRTLLIYSQVPEHETECVTKSYMCPNCPDSTEVPTYLMISHFKEKHSNCYLDTSYFSIDIRESLEVSKFFLYRYQDNLFIIAYKFYASTEYFTLSVMFLGISKDAEKINQRFTLGAGKNFKIHTREKPCVALDLFNVGGFKIVKTDIPEKFKMIYITFKIDTVNITGFIQIPTGISVGTKQIERKWYKLRSLFLNDNLKKINPKFSLNSNATSMLMKNDNVESEIVLLCFNCSLLCHCYLGDKLCFIVKGQKCYSLCYYCDIYFDSILRAEYQCHNIISRKNFNLISFFCTWKCGKYFNKTSLVEHEMNCSFQPIQKCPVKYCQSHDKLSAICQHLLSDHSPEFPVLSVDSGDEASKFSLLIENSPIKKFIIVSYKFMLMKFIWIEPHWIIKISKCNKSEDYGEGFRAKALLFDKRDTFLGHVEEKLSMKIHHTETLIAKCYFEV